MKSILVQTGQAGKDGKYESAPTLVANSLTDAVDMILAKSAKKIML